MLLNTVVKTVKRDSHRGSQSITTDLITTDIVACVNRALRDIEKLLPKRFWWKKGTIALTAGVAGTPAVYSLPSDLNEPSTLYYTVSNTYYLLKKVDSDIEWVKNIWNPLTPTNNPYLYREIGLDANGYRQIELFPVPGQSITLNVEYYKLKATDLTTANLTAEVPDIPDKYQDAVEKGALYYFLKGFDDPLGQTAKADYSEALMALEIGDERDEDSLLQMRMGLVRYELPGFRLG